MTTTKYIHLSRQKLHTVSTGDKRESNVTKLTSVWHGMTTTEGESKGNYEGINVGSYGMKEGYSTDANGGMY